VKKAEKIVKSALIGIPQVAAMTDRTFYAVGGTWRALARLHMRQIGYPLNVMHNYAIPARDALDFASIVERADSDSLAAIDSVSAARRPLLAYGAVVLEQLVKRGNPTRVVVSALGLREGLLFENLSEEERKRDPLIVAANDLNQLRSRSPRHGWDLIAWSDALFASLAVDESEGERRLRHAACLLADIGWRAHPDYRGEQSMSIIANAAFVGVDHPGRAYLALSVFYRHVGLADSNLGPQLRELAGLRLQDRARILGAAMRVAYLISAAMPDVLARTPLQAADRHLLLCLPADLGALASERLVNRLRQLARLVGREARVAVGP
jgi:exopolyphosphatase/guanosine-5'-triphosphate,3'-diphosphate pyrophosphatase